jgi:hypothetical protein
MSVVTPDFVLEYRHKVESFLWACMYHDGPHRTGPGSMGDLTWNMVRVLVEAKKHEQPIELYMYDHTNKQYELKYKAVPTCLSNGMLVLKGVPLIFDISERVPNIELGDNHEIPTIPVVRLKVMWQDTVSSLPEGCTCHIDPTLCCEGPDAVELW